MNCLEKCLESYDRHPNAKLSDLSDPTGFQESAGEHIQLMEMTVLGDPIILLVKWHEIISIVEVLRTFPKNWTSLWPESQVKFQVKFSQTLHYTPSEEMITFLQKETLPRNRPRRLTQPRVFRTYFDCFGHAEHMQKLCMLVRRLKEKLQLTSSSN